MPRLIVLGTYHDVQGLKKFTRNVNDPDYKTLLKELMKHGVDFIFEEAGGKGPSVASEMVASNQYVDIDSEATDEALSTFREPAKATLLFPLWALAPENWREERWVEKIKAQQFETGLVICGVAHSLSIAFRLGRERFDVKWYLHEPLERLCSELRNMPKV